MNAASVTLSYVESIRYSCANWQRPLNLNAVDLPTVLGWALEANLIFLKNLCISLRLQFLMNNQQLKWFFLTSLMAAMQIFDDFFRMSVYLKFVFDFRMWQLGESIVSIAVANRLQLEKWESRACIAMRVADDRILLWLIWMVSCACTNRWLNRTFNSLALRDKWRPDFQRSHLCVTRRGSNCLTARNIYNDL